MNKIIICSECGRVINPEKKHYTEDGDVLPDGLGFQLKDPKNTIYNLCFECLIALGAEGQKFFRR